MEYIQVTKDNIGREHICCAISNDKDIQVSAKKAWLLDRFEDGLVFLKSTERGKCFIEYMPAENAWNPIEAGGYMHIDCLWVSGSLKGHGYSADLLKECERDSREKKRKGLCILSSRKKKPFLSDPGFLKHMGFEAADQADNGIELWVRSFDTDTALPKFKDCARHPRTDEGGFVLFYTSQCPFSAKYVPMIEKCAEENEIPFKPVYLRTKEEAQNAPSPITNYALFYDGRYLTNEQMNPAKFLKLAGGIIKRTI